MAPRLKVVGDGDRVEAEILGQSRELQQLPGAELLSGSLVAKPKESDLAYVQQLARQRG